MNQTVIRMYVFILVGLLAVILALWPRRGPFRWSWALTRFAVIAGSGLVFLVFGFHSAGRVDGLRLGPSALLVQESFPGRAWSPEVWTSVEYEDGVSAQTALAPAAVAPPPPSSARLRLMPSVSARLERVESATVSVPVGPKLRQPTLVWADDEGAVVAAYDTVYAPETLFVARYGLDGVLAWRVDGRDLGVAEGRLRRASRLPDGGDLLLVFTGLKTERTFLESWTFADHVIVARLDREGRPRWSTAF